jgi:adenine/guanine phosphoribosyltransferase-like PRPP-binding protein
MIRTYTADDLIRVAKRENNQKRSFLYVDPYQGKHIPVSPSEALDVSGCLAERVSETFHGERLLVIGFAETATAIGAMLAYSLESVTAFMTTTRENVPDTDYLYFTESHSHATEQRLALRGLREQLIGADRVVFAEDEVTTGSTIRKLINALREHFPELPLRFGIASRLNSMSY